MNSGGGIESEKLRAGNSSECDEFLRVEELEDVACVSKCVSGWRRH